MKPKRNETRRINEAAWFQVHLVGWQHPKKKKKNIQCYQTAAGSLFNILLFHMHHLIINCNGRDVKAILKPALKGKHLFYKWKNMRHYCLVILK